MLPTVLSAGFRWCSARLPLVSAGAPEGDGSPDGVAGDAEIHAATAKHIATYSVVRKLRVAVHGGKRGREHGGGSQARNPKKERTPSRGGQTEPAVFPSPGRLHFLKERKTASSNDGAFWI